MLKQFTKCRSFRFTVVDYGLLEEDLRPMLPKCFVAPSKDKRRPLIHCDVETAGQWTEELTTSAITSMINANCVVERLEFGQGSMSDMEQWEDYTRWERLDLSRLKHLTFEPLLPNFMSDEDAAKMEQYLQEDLESMFRKAQGVLESFDSRRCFELGWFGEPVSLPKLRRLVLGPCEITSSYLCDWLKVFPNLEYIGLRVLDLRAVHQGDEESDEEWKAIFRAIREHPKIRRGEYEPGVMYVKDRAFAFNKDQAVVLPGKYDAPGRSSEFWVGYLEGHGHDIGTWLELYVRGKIEWTGLLEEDFDGWGNESDEYEDEYELEQGFDQLGMDSSSEDE